MFPATRFKGRRIALFGLARSGLACAAALVAGGAEVVACDDGADARAAAAAAGIPIGDLARRRFRDVLGAGAVAGHSPDPSPPALERRQGAGRRHRGDRRHRGLHREIAGTGSRAGRHHRHQWQVDDHRAHRPCAARGRARCPCRRQYRHGGVPAAAARARPGLCPRALLLSDRPHARAQARCGGADEPDARPSRPPWHAWPATPP